MLVGCFRIDADLIRFIYHMKCIDAFLVDLLGLLNWRSNPEDLDQILRRLMEVEGGEIVKVSPLPQEFEL